MHVCVQLCMIVCVNGCLPEPISEMGFHIADSMAGPPGLKPQKLFNFRNFARGKKYHLPPQKLFSISHHLKGQIMHPINTVHFFCAKSDKIELPLRQSGLFFKSLPLIASLTFLHLFSAVLHFIHVQT